MTREEAIKSLQNIIEYWTYKPTEVEAAKMAIDALRPVSREQVENYLYRITYDLLEGVVEEQAAGMSVRPEDKAFIANVYKYAFVGLMLDWIKHDMKGEPKQIIDRLDRVIHGSVTAALERFRLDAPSDPPV